MNGTFKYVLGLSLVMSWGLRAQTAKADFDLLRKHYETFSQLGYEAHYTLFAEGKAKPVETFTMQFKRAGFNYYSKNEDHEMLINERYVLFLDHDDKEVLLQKNVNTAAMKEKIKAEDMTLLADTLMKLYSKVELLTKTGDMRTYALTPRSGPYTRVDVSIDVKARLLREMVLHVAEAEEIDGKPMQVHIKVVFKNYITSGMNMAVFGEGNYVEKAKGRFKLKTNYSNYVLHDETN
jgi:hypothetical protein